MGLLQEKLAKYDLPQKFMAQGVYPYFREIEGKQGTEVEMGGHEVLMFGSNAYTGLTGDASPVRPVYALEPNINTSCPPISTSVPCFPSISRKYG